MKTRILNAILDIAFAIDKWMGWITEFDYETAPYCGHHYNGHAGKLTSSDYHEGDGGIRTNGHWVRIHRYELDEPKIVLEFPKPRSLYRMLSSLRVDFHNEWIFLSYNDRRGENNFKFFRKPKLWRKL